MNKKTFLILSKIAKLYFPNVANAGLNSGELTSLILKMLREQGTLKTVKFLKRVRLHYTRYLSGRPLLEQEEVPIDESGLPTCLPSLRRLLGKDNEHER
jgi:hypothetical protein